MNEKKSLYYDIDIDKFLSDVWHTLKVEETSIRYDGDYASVMVTYSYIDFSFVKPCVMKDALWVDYNLKNDTWNFNKYIFHLDNSRDLLERLIQSDEGCLEIIGFQLDGIFLPMTRG